MSQFIDNIQDSLKRNSQNLGIFLVRLFSGFVVGLTLSLIFQQIFSFGNLLYWFVIILGTTLFMRSTKGWSFVAILGLDFVLVLIALILKMYILIAPGA